MENDFNKSDSADSNKIVVSDSKNSIWRTLFYLIVAILLLFILYLIFWIFIPQKETLPNPSEPSLISLDGKASKEPAGFLDKSFSFLDQEVGKVTGVFETEKNTQDIPQERASYVVVELSDRNNNNNGSTTEQEVSLNSDSAITRDSQSINSNSNTQFNQQDSSFNPSDNNFQFEDESIPGSAIQSDGTFIESIDGENFIEVDNDSTGNYTISFGGGNCHNDEILKWNKGKNKWECTDDLEGGSGIAYTAGNGVSIADSTISVNPLSTGGLEITSGQIGINLDGGSLALSESGLKVTSVGTDEITDNSISGVDLAASNTPSDGEYLTYNQSSGGFSWSADGGAADIWVNESGDTMSGNLGILTVGAPIYPLDVVGDINTSTLYRIGGNAVLQSANFFGIFGSLSVGLGTPSVGTGLASNTFVGVFSGSSNTDGTYNAALGTSTLQSNTTGISNVAIGYETLRFNTTGSDNVGIGMDSLITNTTGSNNIAIGTNSLLEVTTGGNNIAIGTDTGHENEVGTGNIFIGYQAGYNESGSNKLYIDNSNTTTPLIHGDFSTNLLTINGDLAVANAEEYFIGSTQVLSKGNGQLAGNLIVGDGGGSMNIGDYNTVVGLGALLSNTDGYQNIAMGSGALYSNTTGYYNNALGYNALYYNTTGVGNNAIGDKALYSNTASYSNNALGNSALYSNTTGSYNNALGGDALYNNTIGNNNNAVGNDSLRSNTTGSYNNAVGDRALYSNTTGNNNVVIGYRAGYLNSTGSGNIFLGYRAGTNETGSDKLYIDNSNTTTPLIYGDFSTNLLTINGDLAVANAEEYFVGSTQVLSKGNGQLTGNLIVGDGGGSLSHTALDEGYYNTAVGLGALNAATTTSYNVALGYQAGYATTTGTSNTFLGNQAGYTNTTGYGNVFIGDTAGYLNVSGRDNTFIGWGAGYENTANDNTFVGSSSGGVNTTGSSNVFLGSSAGASNTTANGNVFLGNNAGSSTIDGGNNVFIGADSGYYNTTGYFNTFVGERSGESTTGGIANTYLGEASGLLQETGLGNVLVGVEAGRNNVAGDQNIFLGYQAGYHETGSNKLFIDNTSRASEADARAKALVYGVFDAATANQSLTVNGNFNVLEGMVVGSPTGGNKGAGTINASAVYDDNVLLTDYVFDKYFDGQVGVEDQSFHGDFSILTMDEMADYVKANRHLPTIPGRDEWENSGKFSLGKLVNHLWETSEVNSLYVTELNNVNKEQDIKLANLENRITNSIYNFTENPENSPQRPPGDSLIQTNEANNNEDSDKKDDKKIADLENRLEKLEENYLNSEDSDTVVNTTEMNEEVSNENPEHLPTHEETVVTSPKVSTWSEFDNDIVTIIKELVVTAKTAFGKSVAFLAEATFWEKAEFKNKVTFNNDTVGEATIEKGKTEIQINFNNAYPEKPIINITPIGLHKVVWGLDNIKKGGFSIKIEEKQEEDIRFNWQAFGSNSNPEPQASSESQPQLSDTNN